MSLVLSSLPQLPAPLNATKLHEEADDAYCILTQTAASTSKSTSELKLSQCVVLSGIVSVQVPGSVEEERLFSNIAFIKDDRRNYLEEQHLNACLTLAAQRMWKFEQLKRTKWLAAKQRHSGAIGRSAAAEAAPHHHL
eukprot:1160819-Pelagomonas_calceolata.AAC.5